MICDFNWCFALVLTREIFARRRRSLAYYYRHKEKVMAARRQRYFANHEENKKKHREAQKKRQATQTDAVRAYRRSYYHANIDKCRALNRGIMARLKAKDPATFLAKRRKYLNDRRKTDPQFKLVVDCRNRMNAVLKLRSVSKDSWFGYSGDDLYETIGRKFGPGMSWEAYLRGEIHIDHVVPCAHFDLTKPGEIRKCFSLANLQPLWAKDNLRKNCRLPVQTEMALVA